MREEPGRFDAEKWTEAQIRRYGPVMGGKDLRNFLGFRTSAAFQKARSMRGIDVAIFRLPGRKGSYAVTEEACAWLLAQRAFVVDPDHSEGATAAPKGVGSD
jgi:hypothetical protein